MNGINNRRRSGAFLTAGGALALALLTALTVFQVVDQEDAVAQDEPTSECATAQHFFALDPGKETPNAFGPGVIQTKIDEQIEELHSRRCQDPALTASHEAAWGLIDKTQINDEARRLAVDPAAWTTVIGTMEELEAASVTSITFVPARTATLYMVVDEAGWPIVREGYTVYDGLALTFTHPDGRAVELKLPCGFQPVWHGPPPPPCEGECIIIPPPPPPPCEGECIVIPPPPPPTCPPETPYGEWPVCKDGPESLPRTPPGGGDPAPVQPDPVGSPTGGEPAVVYVPPVVPTTATPPVVTPVPGPQPTVEPSTQPPNNGVVVPNPGSGAACNPEFQSCP